MKATRSRSRYCRGCTHLDKDGICEIAKRMAKDDVSEDQVLKVCADAGWRDVRESLSSTHHSASTGQWADALKGR